jgi:hypothetical protein
MFGYAVEDLSVGVDLDVSRTIVCVGAARGRDGGAVSEEPCVDIAGVHFDGVGAEHGDERGVCRRAEFNAVGTVALIRGSGKWNLEEKHN